MRKAALVLIPLLTLVFISLANTPTANAKIITDNTEIKQNTSQGVSHYPGCMEVGKTVTFTTELYKDNGDPLNKKVRLGGSVKQAGVPAVFCEEQINGNFTCNFQFTQPGQTFVILQHYRLATWATIDEFRGFQVKEECDPDGINENPGDHDEGTPKAQFKLCRQAGAEGSDAHQECMDCVGDEIDVQGVWTAVGCIPTDHTKIVQVFIKLGLMIGGGVALLLILIGSFMLSVSQGDPKKTSEAKEMITSAIIGLIFIIFSVSILQFIGVNILHIPGFAGN
jgi:hypothetical protein